MFYAEDILHRGEVKRCNWKIQRRMFGITLLNLQKKELHFIHLWIQQLPRSQEHSICLINVIEWGYALKLPQTPDYDGQKDTLDRYLINLSMSTLVFFSLWCSFIWLINTWKRSTHYAWVPWPEDSHQQTEERTEPKYKLIQHLKQGLTNF